MIQPVNPLILANAKLLDRKPGDARPAHLWKCGHIKPSSWPQRIANGVDLYDDVWFANHAVGNARVNGRELEQHKIAGDDRPSVGAASD
jgi:queuine/archaeosine tRNA-ribosyltransferase